MSFSQIGFNGNRIPYFENLNAIRQDDDVGMHDFGFSNQIIYNFQKVFDFFDFSKF